jgi:hypothetical protein
MRFVAQLPRFDGTVVTLLCTVQNCAMLSVGFYVTGAGYVEIAAPVSNLAKGQKPVSVGKDKEMEEIERISRSILGEKDAPP